MNPFLKTSGLVLVGISLTGLLSAQPPGNESTFNKVLSKEFDKKKYEFDSFSHDGVQEVGFDPQSKEVTYLLVKSTGTLSLLLAEPDSIKLASEEAMNSAIIHYGRVFAKNPATVVEKKKESVSRTVKGSSVDAKSVSKGNRQNLEKGQVDNAEDKDESVKTDQSQTTLAQISKSKSNSNARVAGNVDGDSSEKSFSKSEESTKSFESAITTDWVYDSNFRSMIPIKRVAEGQTLSVWYLVLPKQLQTEPSLDAQDKKNSQAFQNEGFKRRESK